MSIARAAMPTRMAAEMSASTSGGHPPPSRIGALELPGHLGALPEQPLVVALVGLEPGGGGEFHGVEQVPAPTSGALVVSLPALPDRAGFEDVVLGDDQQAVLALESADLGQPALALFGELEERLVRPVRFGPPAPQVESAPGLDRLDQPVADVHLTREHPCGDAS